MKASRKDLSKKDYEIFRKKYEKQIEETEASINYVNCYMAVHVWKNPGPEGSLCGPG